MAAQNKEHMNSRHLISSSLLIATACTCLAAVQVGPVTMIGNLDEYPAPPAIGEVRTPAAGIYFGTAFKTDAEAYYVLDSIGLERFLFDPAVPLQVTLYRQDASGGWEAVAELGDPIPVAAPTRNPDLSTYVSYAPTAEFVLEPSSTYMVAVGQPADSTAEAGLVFTTSENYAAMPGWSIASDHFGIVVGGGVLWTVPFSPGHLKFQVNAVFLKSANQPPDVSQARASIARLWPATGLLVPFQVVGVTDPDGDQVRVKITSIVQDEPVADAPDRKHGRSGPIREVLKALKDKYDAVLLWDNLAMARAERNGAGNGRVYSVTFVASDGKGGESEGVVFINVPHDARTPAIDDGPATGYYDSFGELPSPEWLD